MNELVECHSGFTYADRPVALTWEGQRLEIAQILTEWRTPEKSHFRVRTSDGREFELAYSQAMDTWEIENL
jgi:putative sterol carrier protein